ncbi:hypothetical protein GXW82_18640 [Streptacidiphilus sp. 4-A2]|nr:hypothetical protein [Streptacidiphilus sp. 4-A2]
MNLESAETAAAAPEVPADPTEAAEPAAAGPVGDRESDRPGTGPEPQSAPGPQAEAAAVPAQAAPAQTPAELAAAMRAVGPGEAAVPDRAEALRATAEVLAAGGAPAHLLDATVTALGEGAPALLRDDPWTILTVPGVRPEHADGFARGLLGADCGPGDQRRAEALTGWLLEQAAVRGHTAVELTAVQAGLEQHAVPRPGARWPRCWARAG